MLPAMEKSQIKIGGDLNMKKVCLNTERMLDEANPQDDDYNLWKKVYELMNGEDAFVYESSIEKGKWVFCGLVDGKTEITNPMDVCIWNLRDIKESGGNTDDRSS